MGRGRGRTANSRPACRVRISLNTKSASWSTRSASGSAKTMSFVWHPSKARCPSAPCGACRRCIRPRAGVAEHFAATGAALSPARENRGGRRAARSSAAAFHLAQCTASRRQGRRPRTHSWRMVAERQGDVAGPRLLPGRDSGRHALLAVPRRACRARRKLVAAWRW